MKPMTSIPVCREYLAAAPGVAREDMVKFEFVLPDLSLPPCSRTAFLTVHGYNQPLPR